MTNGDKERLRQQAAIAAMQGILANPARCVPDFDGEAKLFCQLMAGVAVAYADALVAEIEKEGDRG